MYIGVDLGSTNIKAAIYDKEFNLIDRQSRPVNYIRDHGFVEFDAVEYYEDLVGLLADMITAAVNEALTQCKEEAAREIGKLTGGVGGGLL